MSETQYFDNSDYFDYLKQHCTEQPGEEADGRVTGRAQIRTFFDRMELGPQAATLEVGCGTGRILNLLESDYGVAAHGVDPCAEAIEFAVKERPDRTGQLRYIAGGDLSALPSAAFDRIIFWGVFELTDQNETVINVARILRPGGLCLLNNARNRAFRDDDVEMCEAVSAFERKRIPIRLTDIAALEALIAASGLLIKHRAIFDYKHDVAANQFSWDRNRDKGFAEATYILSKPSAETLTTPVAAFTY